MQFRNSKIQSFILVFAFVATLTLVGLFGVNIAQATSNQQINYQGKMTDSAGATLTDGNYTFVFSFYTVATGGTAVWTETRTVTLASGLFSVMLGASTPFPTDIDPDFFNRTLYLGVKVGTDPEMTPRKVLGSVPSAFEALRLDGNASSTAIDISDYLTVGGTATLATTTMSFGSGFQGGTGNFALFKQIDMGGSSMVSYLDMSSIGGSLPYGAIKNGFIVSTMGGTDNPFILFDNPSGPKISMATTTTALNFTGATGYNFDATTTMTWDSSSLSFGETPYDFSGIGLGIVNVPTIRPSVSSIGRRILGVDGTIGIASTGSERSGFGFLHNTAGLIDGLLSLNPRFLSDNDGYNGLELNGELRTYSPGDGQPAEWYDIHGKGFYANGPSTLATTTMDFTDSSLDFQNYRYTYGPFNFDFPYLKFNSDNLGTTGGINSNHVGIMDDTLMLTSIDNTTNPALIFSSIGTSLAKIQYATTSEKLDFSGADLYNFDTDLTVGNTIRATCFSTDGVTCITGGVGGSDSLWATSSLVVYPNLPSGYAVVIGGSVTTTDSIFEVRGGLTSLLGGLYVGGNVITGESSNTITSADNSFILGGSDNSISSVVPSGIIGGQNNTVGPNGGIIISNIVGNNYVSGGDIFGANNSTSTLGGSIFGGDYNETIGPSINTVIVGGTHNTASSTNSGIFAGGYNYAGGWGSSVVGGSNNQALGLNSGTYSGTYNIADGYTSSILGGNNNQTGSLSNYSIVLGGASSTVTGNFSSVLAGYNNLITGNNSVALDGSHNTIDGDFSDIIGGSYNWVSGNNSYAFGDNMTISGHDSVGFGLSSIGNSTTSNRVIAQNNTMAIMGGQVGIGTVAPTVALDVVGSINIDSGLNSAYKINGQNVITASTTLYNYFFGSLAGNLTMTGISNTAIGYGALYGNTTGTENTAIGYGALSSNLSGAYNTAIGSQALESNTTGGWNTAIGSSALRNNLSGFENTALGFNALSNNLSGSDNTVIGWGVLVANTEGSGNSAIGVQALNDNTTGSYNTAVGQGSLSHNTTGSYNSVLGYGAGGSIGVGSSGSDNVAVGNNSLGINETGSYNVAVGSEALPQNVSSIGTVALGYRAGNRDTNTTNHTGSYNTYLGYMSGLGVPSTTPIYNAIAIGQNSIVSASNTMALGGLGVDEVKVGIGTSTAQYSLVVGGGTNTSSIQVPKGSICVTGSGWCTPGTAGHIAAVAYDSLGADLAENYQVFETGIEVGDIVSVTDLNNSTTTNTTETFGVKKATKNNEVIGIISTAPGVTLGSAGGPNENKLPVALSGRVPVKVNLEGGEIKVGDPITLSSVSGVGMKATSSSQTIGTALTTFDSHSSTNHQGVGKITVFVNLSYTHIDSQISQGQINITSPWTLDEATGQIKLYASLDLSNLDIVNVRSITSASGNWSIDEAGNLVTKSIKTDKLCLGVTCVTEGELQILLNKAQISPILTLPTIDTSPSATTTASTTDPGSGDTNLPDVPAITTPPIVEPVSELSPPPVPPELPAPPEPTPSPEPVAN